MANWCSVGFALTFDSPEGADAYMKTLESRGCSERGCSTPIDIGGGRPLFESYVRRDSYDDCRVLVSGEVKWALEHEDFVGIVKLAMKHLTKAVCNYYEETEHIMGVYTWTKDSPDSIADKCIADEDWPEFEGDIETD